MKVGVDRRGWRIDKTINIGDIIQLAFILVPVLVWASTVETRFTGTQAIVSGLERQVIADKLMRDQQRAEDRQAAQATMIDLQQQIREMDRRMIDRLDRIGEKVGAQR